MKILTNVNATKAAIKGAMCTGMILGCLVGIGLGLIIFYLWLPRSVRELLRLGRKDALLILLKRDGKIVFRGVRTDDAGTFVMGEKCWKPHAKGLALFAGKPVFVACDWNANAWSLADVLRAWEGKVAEAWGGAMSPEEMYEIRTYERAAAARRLERISPMMVIAIGVMLVLAAYGLVVLWMFFGKGAAAVAAKGAKKVAGQAVKMILAIKG